MTLRPCPACRRHVREEACPFCGATVPAASPRPALAGRLSRAAVFAGATLAGCANPPPAQHAAPPPPPPTDEKQEQQREPDRPPPPPDDRAFAKPPAATAGITGLVTNSGGSPRNGVSVSLSGNGVRRQAITDGTGAFEFRDLAAGDYAVTLEQQSNHPRRPAPPLRKSVTVAEGKTEQLRIVLDAYMAPVDTGPCCKPYGAPPARRRVV